MKSYTQGESKMLAPVRSFDELDMADTERPNTGSIPLDLSARINWRVFNANIFLASVVGNSRSNVSSDAIMERH